jgi:hypothetical protein
MIPGVQLFAILLFIICISLSTACKPEPALDCKMVSEVTQSRFDSLQQPIFIPEKNILKNEVTRLFLLRDSVRALTLRFQNDTCLEKLDVILSYQLDYYKKWTTDLQPYLPEKKWQQLSTRSEKNSFLKMLPALFSAGKKCLLLKKLNIKQEAIHELESFYLLLQKDNKPHLDENLREDARLALKDFLAFLLSHRQ